MTIKFFEVSVALVDWFPDNTILPLPGTTQPNNLLRTFPTIDFCYWMNPRDWAEFLFQIDQVLVFPQSINWGAFSLFLFFCQGVSDAKWFPNTQGVFQRNKCGNANSILPQCVMYYDINNGCDCWISIQNFDRWAWVGFTSLVLV